MIHILIPYSGHGGRVVSGTQPWCQFRWRRNRDISVCISNSLRRRVNIAWCPLWLTLHVSQFREKPLWAPGQRPKAYSTWITMLYALLMKLRKTTWVLGHQWHKVPMLSDSTFRLKKMYCDIGFSILYQSFNHRYHHKNFCFLLSRCFHSIY